jgi:hypothetical protein
MIRPVYRIGRRYIADFLRPAHDDERSCADSQCEFGLREFYVGEKPELPSLCYICHLKYKTYGHCRGGAMWEGAHTKPNFWCVIPSCPSYYAHRCGNSPTCNADHDICTYRHNSPLVVNCPLTRMYLFTVSVNVPGEYKGERCSGGYCGVFPLYNESNYIKNDDGTVEEKEHWLIYK